jgi:aminopeptidase-like protein
MSVKKFHNLAKKNLFPICRSITGNGVRKTLYQIKKNFPKLKIYEKASQTKVFDWKVPPEWNIKNAFVIDKYGNKIIDFKLNNLHIINYSIPINKYVVKKEFFKHLYSLPNQPEAIPYITSYYQKYWGFCVTHKQKLSFDKKYEPNDKFKIVINSNLNTKGNLTFGELILRGKTKQEILISTYICHPSMANNELSGPIVSMSLINYFLKKKNLKKTIRFLFIPETIGSISYLSTNLDHLKKNVIAGFNLSCLGDDRTHSFMTTKYGDTLSDKVIIKAYKKLKIKYKKFSFLDRGSDERQYNSPGIDLPIASIFRTKYGEYPEYHTSLDNFDLVSIKGLTGGFNVTRTAINLLLDMVIPKTSILCEPHMSKRKLYPSLSTKNTNKMVRNYMNFIQYADGKNDLDQISQFINLKLKEVKKIYKLLKRKKVIE